MSQGTLVSRPDSNAPSPWFPIRPPRGYQALPCDGSEDYSDVKLHPLKPASDIEAAPTTDSHCARTCVGSSTSRVLLTFFGFFTGSTLAFSACAWLAGVLLPGSPTSSGPRHDHTDSGSVGVLKVFAVGSLVVALAPCGWPDSCEGNGEDTRSSVGRIDRFRTVSPWARD
ncbi:hypothetical protein V8D89_007060 [Ganoderma adspersum]